MIREIIDSISTQLVQSNSWLSEIRSVGYLNTVSGEKSVTDGIKEIGITDRSGNSGYIRFSSDQNFTTEESMQYAGCQAMTRFTYFMRLVIVAKTELPENITLLLASQLSKLSFAGYESNSVKVRARSGGSNSMAVVQNESGQNQENVNYRTLYIDFTIQFLWNYDCDQIEIDMACDTCTNPLDLGCHQHCETVSIGTNALHTGNYTIKTSFNGVAVTQTFSATKNTEIQIPLENLNENYQFDIRIYDPFGEEITIGLPSEDYDCIRITVTP
ncbi:MAG: hypothetical protein IPP69_15825 [Flavobacteriales bacterium]|nr:hypothetical protein [Flavobacteriales bacterium]